MARVRFPRISRYFFRRKTTESRRERKRPFERFESLEPRNLLAVVQWAVDADGDWGVAANWIDTSTNMPRVPNIGDDVVIDRPAGTFTVTAFAHFGVRTLSMSSDESIQLASGSRLHIDQPSQIDGRLQLSGGTLTAQAQVTLAGPANWTAGTIVAPGGVVVPAGNTLTLSSSGTKSLFNSIRVFGTVIHTGDGSFDLVGSPATLDIQPGGVYDLQSDADSNFGDFNNRGTIRKSAGAGESRLASRINNQGGTIEVQSGQIVMSSGGSSSGGILTVADNSLLQFGGNSPFDLSGELTGSGDGRVEIAAQINAHNTGITFNLPGDLLHWTGGLIFAGGNSPFTNSGTLNISSSSDKTRQTPETSRV